MSTYYNEFDPNAAAWLRELIKDGHIADGVVDERSIADVRPDEIAGFTQCHFFAGIGVWSYALRLAGWPDDRPVWTGSCPCQPFSSAGKGGGFDDERHLWPHFHWLISQCRPAVVLGEQVASKDGLGWLDLLQADLEGSGYTSGAVDTCAAGFGAPHWRQRLYWVGLGEGRMEHAARDGRLERWPEPGGRGAFGGRGAGGIADAFGRGQPGPGGSGEEQGQRIAERGLSGGLADAAGSRHKRPVEDAEGYPWEEARVRLPGSERGPGRLADAYDIGREKLGVARIQRAATHDADRLGEAGGLGNPSGLGRQSQPPELRKHEDGMGPRGREPLPSLEAGRDASRGLENPMHPEWRAQHVNGENGCDGPDSGRQETHGVTGTRSEVRRLGDGERPGPTNGFWRDADWLFCRDGKWRPVEPGAFPLAYGSPARVGRLRGYGNAINAAQAQGFIEAVIEVLDG